MPQEQTEGEKREKQEQENVVLGIYDIENPEPNKSSTTTEEETDSDTFFLNSEVDKNSHLFKMMILQQEVLNKRIGRQAWKKYLSAAFWNYITTPINFSITLLTAIATGQAATANILNPQQTLIILFVTFVLTTTNSFFKLNTKMNLNFEAARRYYSFGSKFEEIYYKPLFTNRCVDKKLKSYNALHDNINKYMLSETIENQNYMTEILYNIVMNTSYINKSKWVNSKERHDDLDGITQKEHDSHSIASRISSLVNSALGKNAIAIDEMTNEKIEDIKKQYDVDKKKQLDEIKWLKETNKKMLEDIQLLKKEKTNFVPFPSPPPPTTQVNPTNFQMVAVESKKDTKEKDKNAPLVKKDESKKDEVNKTSEVTKEDEDKILDKITEYFTKVQKYILNEKKDDENMRTFLKGELSEIQSLMKEVDEELDIPPPELDNEYDIHEFISNTVYSKVYKYFIKLTNKTTDEYIKTIFKEINFTVDPTNKETLSVKMTVRFAMTFRDFCYPLIQEIQKEKEEAEKEKEQNKIGLYEVD